MAYSSFKESGLDGFKTKKIKGVLGSPPQSPTGVSATDIGINREYNNGSASISFIPPTEGEVATSYRVISSPGSIIATGTTSPILITGLQSNTQYTFTVNSVNSIGTSENSAPSNLITATTVPQAPTITSVTHGFEKVTVAFAANGTGGKSISLYTAIPNSGSSQSAVSSPINVTSLSAGTSYTFTVTATNANGVSAASSISSSSIPFSASGGSITTYTGYRVHSFTSTQSFVVNGNTAPVDYLTVAGGGGGGRGCCGGGYGAGGGGGGGFLTSNTSIPVGTHTITVGGGGSGYTGGTGSNGVNSSIGSIVTSTGGGGGGRGGAVGSSGGSGGGGGQYQAAGTGVSGQGYNGGTSCCAESAGGGGGAGAVGGSPSGGNGAANSLLNGSPIYYAGGGGGGDHANRNNNGGLGGGGNGGDGSYGNGRNNISAGGTNTGGGGGGAIEENNDHNGENGGSGIVIIRYAT